MARRKFFHPPSERAYQKAHPELYRTHISPLPPTLTKLLEVSNEFFTAGAVWTRRANVWSCTQAAPILAWMVGLNDSQAKLELLRRGCSWVWVTDLSPAVNSEAGIAPIAQQTDRTKKNKMRSATGDVPPRYPLQDSASGSHSESLVATAGGP